MNHKIENQQLWVILLVVFLGFIGTTLAYPILPPLFLDPTQDSIIPTTWPTSARSIFLGIALAVYPLGLFIGSPILGGCSDSFGRKRVLIISLVGSAVGYFLSALSLQFHSLWLLLFSRFFTGIMEGNFAIVRAMATDLESISKYKSLGRINGMSSFGYVTGPLLGGFLSDNKIISWFSFYFPFYLATLFSLVACVLAIYKLSENKKALTHELTIWQRFNFIARLKILFQQNETLKYLVLISTIFTLSVDIFYEFGPVYLTGLWSMNPSGIAVYTAILAFTLAIGASMLPQYFSRYFTLKNVITIAMLITAIIFAVIAMFPHKVFVFLLFGIAGLSIATVNTNVMIQISDSAHRSIQGEAMGAQLSLRNLGDAIICLIGGFLILSSVILPIALSCLIALFALMIYISKFRKERDVVVWSD